MQYSFTVFIINYPRLIILIPKKSQTTLDGDIFLGLLCRRLF